MVNSLDSTDPSLLSVPSIEEIRAWLVSRIGALVGIDPQRIDTRERFNRHGLDSLKATGLVVELAVWLGRPLLPTVIWEHPTVEALACHLVKPTTHLPASGASNPGRSDSEPIAVIGMACRFPRAASPKAFWDLLRDGVDAISEVPADRWSLDELYDPDPAVAGKVSTRWGGFLPEVDTFDPGFFGIAPREAVQIDPQQRLALELAWEALEDAGIAPSSLKDSRTGVFFGAMWMDYAQLRGEARDVISQHTAAGQDLSLVPGRVSYTLGLMGPSMLVNTACSSSLVAVHIACQSLLRGESRIALAGGFNLLLAPESTIIMSRFGAMAPDGRSKAFDARANGYVRGEGGGVIVLKRLSDALADGDRIDCVIRGSAINNDGFSNGLTAPSPRAQEAVLREAYAAAGVAPTEVQYVEAHGTGTMLGDPIEAGALGIALGAGRAVEQALRIGSVKTNIGHLEAAAGIAGLIKVALAMRHRALPPSLHFQNPNPHIPFEALRLRVQSSLTSWQGDEGRLLAGVSSFGFSGTNCHVVLEAGAAAERRLFLLSAETLEGLRARARETLAALETAEGPTSEAVCEGDSPETLAAWRLAVIVRSRGEISRHLAAFAAEQASAGLSTGRAAAPRPRVAFVFGGQGSQWQGMGRALLQEDAARAELERCDSALRAYVPWSLLQRLQRGEDSLFDQTDFVQPAIFAMQVALAASWRARGLEPDVVVGQSLGEVAAAYVAGALSLDDAARVICRRSQLVTGAKGEGGMAVVGLSLEAAAEVLSPYEGRLSVAVSSGPETTVVAGDDAALQELLSGLQARGVFCRQVRVDYASHSAQMDPLLPELRRVLSGLAPRSGQATFYSTVTAAPLDGSVLDAEYWVRNLREPVLFAPVVRRLAEEGVEVFVEVDPHAVLVPAVEQCLAHDGRRGIAIASGHHDESERVTLLEASGRLLLAGVPVRLNPERGEPAEAVELLPVSGRSPGALVEQARRWADFLAGDGAGHGLRDVAYTAQLRRSHLEHRLAVVGRTHAEIVEQLRAVEESELAPAVSRAPRLVFVFPGYGAQWLGMGRRLTATEPVFRRALVACDAALSRFVDYSVLAELDADADHTRIGEADVVQPLTFALQVALSTLLQHWGIVPAAVVGHSMGEVAAAYVAGALSLEDAARVIVARSRVVREHASHRGGMLMLNADVATAKDITAGHEGRVSLAVVNAPRMTVLSGDLEPLETIAGELQARGVFSRRVNIDYASHSPHMDPLLPLLRSALGGIEPRAATIPFCSTVSADLEDGRMLDAGYWAHNLRAPVQFAPAIERLSASHDIFVEISTHPLLVTAIEETLRERGAAGETIALLRRDEDEALNVRRAVARLHERGCTIDFAAMSPEGGRPEALPTYAWQRERYWLDAAGGGTAGRRGHTGGHPLLGEALTVSTQQGMRLWETSLDLKRLPWLGDHRVQGAVVLPGAAYLEMALFAGAEAFAGSPFQVSEVAIVEALAFAEDVAVPVQLVTTEERPGRLRFQIASRVSGDGSAAWRVHARGVLRRNEREAVPRALDVLALRARLGAATPATEMYAGLTAMGLEYGAAFQGIAEAWRGESEALARVRLPEAAGVSGGYRLHPALLDACIQVMVDASTSGGERTPWVPVAVGAVRLLQRPVGALWCHAQVVRHEGEAEGRRSADLWVVDESGALVVELAGLVLQRLARGAQRREGDDWFLETEWEVAAAVKPKLVAGRVLLLGAGGGLGAALRSALEQAGHSVVHALAGASGEVPSGCRRVDDSGPAGVRVLLAEAFGKQAPTMVVHLGSLEDDATVLDAGSVERALVRGCDSVLATVQALAGMGYRDAPRLWLVTRGAQAVGTHEVAAAQGPLLGLGRVIAMEHAELRCVRVDLDPTRPEGETRALLAELLADDAEEEVALRGGERRVARLVRRVPEAAAGEKLEPAGERPFRLEIDEPGVLDRLVLRAMARRVPGPGEVEIAVEAAGLNFIDVMKAMGIYPGLGDGPIALGTECAGRIVAVGDGVDDVEVGQAVVGFAGSCFGTHVTVDARMVAPRPAGLTAVQAAALPVVFTTAWYGLVHLARLRAGERVLIHSATGGTGLAAVQIARHIGAEVFATAGTAEKRAWLRAQGIAHVMDSRSLEFAEQVLAATGGEGVDVVLNSLSGAAIDASFAALGADGRFIELGKTDIYADRPLGGAHFRRSLSYSAVDLLGLAKRRPDRFSALLAEVMDGFDRGVLEALPVERFPASQAVEAFRRMAQAQHLGKLVLTLADPDAQILVPAGSGVGIRADGSYVVTGGLGGLGLCVAGWLAERGAGHVVLVGRSGAASGEQRAAVAALESRGTRVTVARADVADRGQLERVLEGVAASGMPLRGVVHAAGLLDDAMVLQQTPARLRAVMGPKVQGALHLHTLTRAHALDFFVLYASISGVLGSPGQGNYAAANTFLDALAHRRRQQGLAASSIDWGTFSGVGLAAAEDNRGARLVSRGMRSLTPEEGLSALARVLEGGRTQVGVVPLDVQQWVEFYPAAASSRRLSRLRTEPRAKVDGNRDVLERISAAEPGERALLVQGSLRGLVSQVLRIPEGKLDVGAPLTSLGMDSLMGLELRNRIEATLGVRVPATLLWTYPTIVVLSGHLAGLLSPHPVVEKVSNVENEDGSEGEAVAVEALMAMTDDQRDTLLSEKLAMLAQLIGD